MSGPAPGLHHSDSSLSLRTRKANQEHKPPTESTAKKSYVVDERVFASDLASADEFEENDNLLSNSEVIDMGDIYHPSHKDKKPSRPYSMAVVWQICFFMVVLVFLAFMGMEGTRRFKINRKAFYNGTDYFDTTVIYLSLDGFRNDYLDRKVTPHLDAIASEGIRAEYMNPSFPSITFPNHWTLVTGLYPEAHGIVANEFYDPVFREEFIHKKPEISGDPKWWGGEPIWITAKRQGKKSAVMMWPGSNVPIQSVDPDYYMAYARTITAQQKMDQALAWLDLPRPDRPQSISIYIPQVDQKGHGGGPDGKQLNGVLADMDQAIGHLMKGLEQRNLQDHVHLVVVSDHGMAASDQTRLIFYDHILSPQSESYLMPREAWPLLGLRTKPDAPAGALDQIYQEIQAYMQDHPHDTHFQVYRRHEMPARFHYNATDRIAPIVMIPDVGYAIIRSNEFKPTEQKPYYSPRGIHGYDNLAFEMRAIFCAKGPQIRSTYVPGTVVRPFFNTEMYRFLTRLLDVTPAPNNATLDGLFLSSL
ncbi:hypothetical protein A0J61_08934 [Choanephora cucurbitarum]|uniref:Phosphodiest-domain-containing protein n=1 Tax=Choanephora cucurbitarum TaxID=101091 RepID=A0A1C7N1M6_9FUNG|nr:hypothetical protein A0J61_08934 [Choanephora cucurbitarum]